MEVETIDLDFQGVVGGIAAFLVRGPSGWVLIETGPESTRPRLLAELAHRGVRPCDLTAVLVTHVHLDHAGAAGWFAQEGVTVYVHPRGARHLVDPARLVASARGVYGDSFDGLWGAMVPAPPERVRAVADGEVMTIAGLPLVARETPGHAFHHHVYEVEGALFTGDAAGACLPGSEYLSVTSAPPQFDFAKTLSSLERMEALSPSRLFLTHFGEVSDPGAHFRLYRRAVEASVGFVQARMAEGADPGELARAYKVFQRTEALRQGVSEDRWKDYEEVNGTGMCAEGIRLHLEAQCGEGGTRES